MAARHSSAALWAYLLHVLLWTGAECQTPKPYERLPSEPLFPSDTGEFTWPAGDSTGSFTEGAEMNISWTTTYPAINLWLIINQSWAQPSSIISNSGASSYLWTVSCGQNCSTPFLLRAVTAEPNEWEQEHGGFYSRQFWIKSTNVDQSSSLTTSTVPSTQDLSPSASSSATTSSSEATSSSTTTSDATSAPSATSAAPTPTTLSNGDTAPEASEVQDSGSDNSTITLGVGIGVGLGVALILVAGYAFWRLYRKRSRAARLDLPQGHGAGMSKADAWPEQQHVPQYSTSMGSSTMPTELKASQPYDSTMGGNHTPQEMAGRQMEPQELPTNGWASGR